TPPLGSESAVDLGSIDVVADALGSRCGGNRMRDPTAYRLNLIEWGKQTSGDVAEATRTLVGNATCGGAKHRVGDRRRVGDQRSLPDPRKDIDVVGLRDRVRLTVVQHRFERAAGRDE